MRTHKKPNAKERQRRREAYVRKLEMLRPKPAQTVDAVSEAMTVKGDDFESELKPEAIEAFTAMLKQKEAIKQAALHLAMAKRARRMMRNLAINFPQAQGKGTVPGR